MKYELTSMDEELPLFIYLTTQINVRNILAELYIIEDYLMNCKSIDKLFTHNFLRLLF